ncbi:MAG: universal stress protein [Sulfuritalea sp.]|nr:universal stress protein [Sulfuritalea sp.]
MPLKNLLVHLDQDQRTAARLALAVSLAREHQARLTGVFGQLAQAQQVGLVATWPSQEYVTARDASKAAFEQATAGLAHAEWRDVNRGSETEVLRRVTDLARHADLVVLGQHDDRTRGHVPEEFVSEVILHCGRPVLVVPYIGHFPEVGKHPLIAWNDAREAAHALNDALPLIEGCREAVILSFAARPEEGQASCDEAARHLAAHGIKAKTEVLVVEDFGIMDMLLNRVTDRDADLLVMGAHGHIGFPFVNRGAGTRYILRHMTVPVLMSN